MDERHRTELLAELATLNAEVTAVLAKRKAWMDGHMADFAKVQVGEEIYDLDSGKCLGIVSELYRYWDSQRNPLYDVTMDVNYQFNTGNLIFDNTSRRHVRIGTKADWEAEQTWRNRPRGPAAWDAAWEATFGKKDV